METKPNQVLINEILSLWEIRSFDEASVLILQATALDIQQIKKFIWLNYLSGDALVHVLQNLTLAEWDLCSGLNINENNQAIILPLLIKKYQSGFDASNLSQKIKMFCEIKNDYLVNNEFNLRHEALKFMEHNWSHLINLISSLKIGLDVYEAVQIPEDNNIWGTVAMLKTIKVACKNTSISETEKLYELFLEKFHWEYKNTLKILFAEQVLKKIEK
jgi:hypothetical protein